MAEIKEIEIDKIQSLDFQIRKSDKLHDTALNFQIQKLGQIVLPSICRADNEWEMIFLLNFHKEVNLMIKAGIKTIKVLDLGKLNAADFKILRLTLSDVNSELDPVFCSETIRDLTRNLGQKNLPSKIGLAKDLFNSYEVLLDFEWGFSSKKENKVIKDPDQLQIGW